MYTTESKRANMSMLTFNSYTTGSSGDLHFHFFSRFVCDLKLSLEYLEYTN